MWVKSFWFEVMRTKTFYKTLLLEMRHEFMDVMLKQKLSHHNGCQMGHHDWKKWDKYGQTLVMLTVLFDSEGAVHHKFLPQGKTVTKEYYFEVIKCLCEAIRKKRHNAWRSNRWMLHADNVPTHISLLIHQFLVKHKATVIPQPPYSPDLAPADYFHSPN
jgi:hypothetical protein